MYLSRQSANDNARWPHVTNAPLLIFSLMAAIWTATLAHADSITDPPNAVTKQRVHPVLIRNEYNALLQVTLEVTDSVLQVTAFHFSFDDTDNLEDIDSLQLFYSGDRSPEGLDQLRNGTNYTGAKHNYYTGSSFGNAARAKPVVTFRDMQKLQPGKHIFWLSCKLRHFADLSNKVDASCTSIETSQATCIPTDSTPGIRKRIGVALQNRYDNNVHTYRIPALTTTPQGTLLCVYDMRRTKRRDLQEDIDIGLSRSTDGGQTWNTSRVIMDMGEYGGLSQNQNGCSDPGIVVDQNTGDIFCTSVWMWGKLGLHQWVGKGSEPGYEIGKSAQFLMVRSRDDGLTWTKPENLTRQVKKSDWHLLAPSPQQGLTLRDGTLVMPVEGRDEKDQMFSALMISQDHGTTWAVRSGLAIGNGECQVVQMRNGTLMLNGRTERPTKFRSIYTTTDLGDTWVPHNTHRNTLIEPNCNGSLYRFDYQESGKSKSILLFANPHSQTGRNHQSIQVSFDEGQSWPERFRLLLDEGQGNGYPSISRVGNDAFGIVYEGSQAHLVYEKITISELLK